MNRSLIGLGVVLILIATVLLVATLTSTRVEATNGLFTSFLCEPDEVLTSITRFAGTDDSSDLYYCETEAGDRREVTGRIILIALTAFLIPFLSGMAMIFIGARRMQSQFTKQMLGSFTTQDGQSITMQQGTIPAENMAQVQHVLGAMTGSMTGASQQSLAERLQEIEDARQQGLLSKLEYEKAREAILDKFDD